MYLQAQFGSTYGGLLTVGYTLINPDNTVHTARSAEGVTERGTLTGTYGADIDIPAGFEGEIRWDTYEGSPITASGTITPALTSTDVESIPGSVVSLLGSTEITVISPITDSGNINIIAGDTYDADDGRAIIWSESGDGWPDLTGATVTIDSGAWSHACSVSDAGSDSQSVVLELTAVESAAMTAGSRSYQLRAVLSNSHVITLATGMMNIEAQL
jgi:hypothetical protein